MAKKKKSTSLSWCWYCDREFEDDKVLLQHQKAKHFRCSHCPRRLNTAGGLAVHIDQVHKMGTDKIENALPGRESFDVEIYGMEGIPAEDLAAWRRRRAEVTGVPVEEHRTKKSRTAARPLTVAQIQTQLAAHKAAMSGAPLPGSFGVPPPGFAPPPGFMPPPFAAPAFVLPPGMPPPPPGVTFPPGMPFPPPGGLAGLPAPVFADVPGVMRMVQPPAPVAPVVPGPGTPSGPAATRNAPKHVETVPSSAVSIKEGTVLVYGDNEVSPEEKRANLAQYHVDAAVEVKPDVSELEAAKNLKRPRAADLLEG